MDLIVICAYISITYNFLLLQTACADGVLRIFKLDDASSKSFKYEFQVPFVHYHLPDNTAMLVMLISSVAFHLSNSATFSTGF